jgi:hypothetical protein
MANNILNSDEKIIYNTSKKHGFTEINLLEQALLKIYDYDIKERILKYQSNSNNPKIDNNTLESAM